MALGHEGGHPQGDGVDARELSGEADELVDVVVALVAIALWWTWKRDRIACFGLAWLVARRGFVRVMSATFAVAAMSSATRFR